MTERIEPRADDLVEVDYRVTVRVNRELWQLNYGMPADGRVADDVAAMFHEVLLTAVKAFIDRTGNEGTVVVDLPEGVDPALQRAVRDLQEFRAGSAAKWEAAEEDNDVDAMRRLEEGDDELIRIIAEIAESIVDDDARLDGKTSVDCNGDIADQSGARGIGAKE